MRKLLWIIGATAGGAIGWWLGAKVGVMTPYIVSTVCSLIGVYLGVKIARDYLE